MIFELMLSITDMWLFTVCIIIRCAVGKKIKLLLGNGLWLIGGNIEDRVKANFVWGQSRGQTVIKRIKEILTTPVAYTFKHQARRHSQVYESWKLQRRFSVKRLSLGFFWQAAVVRLHACNLCLAPEYLVPRISLIPFLGLMN